MSGNSQNAGFCTIYPTASGGLGGPHNPGLHCSASLRSPFYPYFFQNSLLLLKVLKALCKGGIACPIVLAYPSHFAVFQSEKCLIGPYRIVIRKETSL